MTRALLLCVAFAFTAAALRADETVYSGPQPTEKLTALKVVGVFGPNAGKEFDLIEELKGAPSLIVFVHEITRPGLQFLRPADEYGMKHAADGLATHFVWLTADRNKTEMWLNWAKNSVGLQSPMSISPDGIEGPGNYGLNRKVTFTVLVAKDNKVLANFAIVQPNETDAPKVLAEVGKMIGQPAPTLEDVRRDNPARPGARPAANAQRPGADNAARIAELEKKIAELTAALDSARAELARLKGGRPGAGTPEVKRPGADGGRPAGRPAANNTPPDPELVNLMRAMIQLNNDQAACRRIAEQMTKWAGDDQARKTMLKEYCGRIADLGYGNDFAKAEIKRLAGR